MYIYLQETLLKILRFISHSGVVYILMFLFFVWGLRYIFVLLRIRSNFIKAYNKIHDNPAYKSVIKNYLLDENVNESNLFSYKPIKARFEEYRLCVLKDKSSDAKYHSLDNYFNQEFIDSCSNIGFCDLIPGLMTGFGILGTFVGLVVGVKGINLDTTTEALKTGITGLLGGIGFAFMTSIVGVLLSTMFSLLYNPWYSRTLKSMNSFLELFHLENLDNSDTQPVNLFLDYQQKQTELLGNLGQNISDVISSNMVQILKPVIEKMEKTIEEFGKFASTQQKEGLEQVVKQFIASMNESLGGQFDELGKTIRDLCEWQKSSVTQLQKIVDGICNTSNEIERINEISQKTIIEMNNFVNKISDMQESINKGMDLARQHIEQGNDISERNMSYIEKLVDCETRISDVAEIVKNQAESSLQMTTKLSEFGEKQLEKIGIIAKQQMDSITETSKNTVEFCNEQLALLTASAKDDIDGISEATKALVEFSCEQIHQVASTAQDEMQLLSETSSRLSTDNANQLQLLTDTANRQMTALATEANTIIQNSQTQMEDFCDKLQTLYEDLESATSEFANFVQSQNQNIIDAVNNVTNGLNSATTSMVASMDTATQNMTDAATTLDQNLDEVLDRTFTEFDTSLSQISSHLSGTIADVRDTMDRLPGVLQNSQRQYDRTIQNLVDETQKYSSVMQQLTSEIQRRLSLLNNIRN